MKEESQTTLPCPICGTKIGCYCNHKKQELENAVIRLHTIAPTPWSVDKSSASRHWTNSISIIDAEGAEVAILTRGYQEGPSLDNAHLIVEAVNARTK